jgi:hypothetical protein
MTKARPEIRLSNETGEETRTALNRYKAEKEMTQEEAIRHLLPQWTLEGRNDPAFSIPGSPVTELEVYDDHVTDWEHIDRVADSVGIGSVRLYYKMFEEQIGFAFCAVIVERLVNHAQPFYDENTRVSVLVWGHTIADRPKYTRFGHDFTDNRGRLDAVPYDQLRDKLRAVFDELDRLESEIG